MPDPDLATDRPTTVRRGRLLVAVVPAAVIAFLALFTVTSLPRTCRLCHQPQAMTAAAGPHASATCYDCHLDNGMWGLAQQKSAEFYRMYPAAVLRRGLTRPARATSRASCLRCHLDVLDKTTDDGHLRIKHAACATDPTCDGCHSQSAHPGRVRWVQDPVMDDCIDCHSKRSAPTQCDTCHIGEGGGRRSSSTPWQVTHGKDWRSTHGLGDPQTCGTCHPVGFCARCHRVAVPHTPDFGATHGKAAIADTDACLVCHKSEKAFCQECHGFPMPHPASFTKQHSAIAKGAKDPRCIRCHVETDCDVCHGNHVHPGASTGVPVPWTSTPEALRP